MSMFNYECDKIHEMGHVVKDADEKCYVSECIQSILEEVTPNYPQLSEYEKEWVHFKSELYQAGQPVPLEYISGSGVEVSIPNSIPFHYKSAILKCSTKYRDIDTGDVLDTFDETKNLELVSVKMPVLKTTGKNLFDRTLIKNACLGNTGLYYAQNGSLTTFAYTYVKNLKHIIVSINDENGNIQMVYSWYDKDKKFITRTYGKIRNTVEVPENAYFVNATFQYFSSNTIPENENFKIQIEEGSVVTPYEPYQSNILTVNEEVTLRGIGEGSNRVEDELNLMTGEVTQRITEIVLSGSEEWVLNRSTTNHNLWMTTIVNPALNTTVRKNNMLCNKLIVENFSGFDAKDYEFISINDGNSNCIYLKLDKTKGSTPTELKNYLQSNPLTVQYQLATESIKKVDLSHTPKPMDGATYLKASSDIIPPTIEVSCPVVSTGAKTLNDIMTGE